METLIINACSWLSCQDRSGYRPDTPTPESELNNDFHLNITSSGQRLKMLRKNSGFALWYKHNEDDVKIVPGRFVDQDLVATDPRTCAINATLSDPSGRYLPRRFNATLADKSRHKIDVYRSIKGTPLNHSGAIKGTVTTKNGASYTPHPWTLITLMVTPDTGAPLKFVAQADQHGEFLIALNGPKLQSVNDPDKAFNATISFQWHASSTASEPANPDTFTACQVCRNTLDDGTLQFAGQLDFTVTAGKVETLASPGQTHLVLQST